MNPIFKVDGHRLTSLNGHESEFYNITPPDLEMMDQTEREQIFDTLESSLVNTSGEIKIYKIGTNLYLNNFCEVNLQGAVTEINDRPIEIFLNGDKESANFYENYLTLGNEYQRVLSVKEFPSTLNQLDSLSWPDFVLNFKKVPKLEAKNKINFKRKLHFSSLFKGMRDLDSENAYYQAENLFEDVTSDIKGLFYAEMFFILRAKTKLELDQITDRVIYDFKGNGAILRVEERGLSYFYQTLVPGVPASFKRSLEMPSDYLSYLVPFHQDLVMEEGFELTSRRNNSVYFDLFNSQALNYNLLITGSTGQGKSMIANKLLWQELGRGTKAVVLDLGNSFVKNAKFHDGSVLSHKFNPIQFKDTRYLKEFILAAVDEKFTKRDEGRLYEAIENLISVKEVSTFKDLVSGLEKDFKGIGYYFKEIEEFFCDETLPLNQFTYCDFTNYPDAMKAPLIIYLIEYFKHLNGEKIFIFDECWHLLDKNAQYIAECFRTFRKHRASAVAISQNLDDFSETQLGRVIIQNTYYKFLFKQSLKESEFLDAHSKNLLDSVQSIKGEYSEFLFLSENIKKPVRYVPTPLEYQVFTSDKNDNQQFDFYLEDKGRFIPFSDAIINFTRIKNPHWSLQ